MEPSPGQKAKKDLEYQDVLTPDLVINLAINKLDWHGEGNAACRPIYLISSFHL